MTNIMSCESQILKCKLAHFSVIIRETIRQTDGHTERQTERHEDRQTDGQTKIQTKRHGDRQTDRHTDTWADRKTERERDTKTDRHTARQTERQTDTCVLCHSTGGTWVAWSVLCLDQTTAPWTVVASCRAVVSPHLVIAPAQVCTHRHRHTALSAIQYSLR